MKSILVLVAAIALPLSLFAQGQIFFANDSTTRFTTNGSLGLRPITGVNAYRIGLYTAPLGTVNESLFTLTAVATNSSSPVALGLFSYPESPLTIAGNNGTPIAVQVKAWSLFAGSSFEAALATGGFLSGQIVYGGKSPIGNVTPAIGGATPPSLFGAAGVFNNGVFLFGPIIPAEPSTYALAALGALVLFSFGRGRAAK